MKSSSVFSHFFDVDYPFAEQANKDPWVLVDEYKGTEDERLTNYIRQVKEIPEELNYDRCSIKDHCGIRGKLLTILQLLNENAGSWGTIPEIYAPYILYDVLHRQDFYIQLPTRQLWGTLIQTPLVEKNRFPKDINKYLNSSDFIPDVGTLLALIYSGQTNDTAIFLVGECSGAFGAAKDPVSALKRENWNKWVMAVDKDRKYRFEKLPAVIKNDICNTKVNTTHRISVNSPIIPKHVLPTLDSALFGFRSYASVPAAPGVLDPVGFYNNIYSVNGLNMTQLLWELKPTLIPYMNTLVMLGLPIPQTISLTDYYQVSLTYSSFRELQKTKYRYIYRNCLHRFLEIIGINPVKLTYTATVAHHVHEVYLRHVLTSMAIFIQPQNGSYYEQIFDLIQRHLLKNTNRELLRVQIDVDIQMYKQTPDSIETFRGRILTSSTAFVQTLARVMPNFTQYSLSDLNEKRQVCTHTAHLLSQFMIFVLRFKIVPMLKWTEFFYITDGLIHRPGRDYSTAIVESIIIPSKLSEISILPLTVDNPTLGHSRILLVFFPDENVIEYYDPKYSAETKQIIKYTLYYSIPDSYKKFDFIEMFTSQKFKNTDCSYLLPYLITFATQTPRGGDYNDRIASLNENIDLTRAKKMYLSLFASAYSWLEKYTQGVKHVLWKQYSDIISEQQSE